MRGRFRRHFLSGDKSPFIFTVAPVHGPHEFFEGAHRTIARDRVGLGVMMFCDNVFKYVSNMVKHVPELAEGTSA